MLSICRDKGLAHQDLWRPAPYLDHLDILRFRSSRSDGFRRPEPEASEKAMMRDFQVWVAGAKSRSLLNIIAHTGRTAQECECRSQWHTDAF